MKVVCKNNTTLSGGEMIGLTVGKAYDVIEMSPGRDAFGKIEKSIYKILDDKSIINWYSSFILVTQEQWRELQLSKLVI